ncbi:hypothetical protein V8F06_011593 [Rhypophila decipiens]
MSISTFLLLCTYQNPVSCSYLTSFTYFPHSSRHSLFHFTFFFKMYIFLILDTLYMFPQSFHCFLFCI